MEKKALIKKYIDLFEKILAADNIETQQEIAREIAGFSGKVNDEVEEKYFDEPIQIVQNACLPMEHWKDETECCNLTEKDIKDFLEQLKIDLKSSE
jgi:hypothetical protein